MVGGHFGGTKKYGDYWKGPKGQNLHDSLICLSAKEDQGLFLVLRGRGLEIVCFVVAAACCSQSHLCLAITSLKAVYARCSFCKPTIKCFFFNFYVIEGGIASCEYFVASFCHPITLPVVGACVLFGYFSLIFFDVFCILQIIFVLLPTSADLSTWTLTLMPLVGACFHLSMRHCNIQRKDYNQQTNIECNLLYLAKSIAFSSLLMK